MGNFAVIYLCGFASLCCCTSVKTENKASECWWDCWGLKACTEKMGYNVLSPQSRGIVWRLGLSFTCFWRYLKIDKQGNKSSSGESYDENIWFTYWFLENHWWVSLGLIHQYLHILFVHFYTPGAMTCGYDTQFDLDESHLILNWMRVRVSWWFAWVNAPKQKRQCVLGLRAKCWLEWNKAVTENEWMVGTQAKKKVSRQ